MVVDVTYTRVIVGAAIICDDSFQRVVKVTSTRV